MPRIEASSPDEYIANLPPERREAIAAVREVIRENLPAGYEEGIEFGMIAYYVPLDRFPGCVRFRRLDDLPLEVIGETIARTDLERYLAHYQAARGSSRATRASKAG